MQIALVILAFLAQEPRKVSASDLTLGNLFSEGWGEPWIPRSERGATPDMALLRVTTNFLERELRIDYAYTYFVRNNARIDDTTLLNGLIAYALDRRVMIEVIGNYQWNYSATAPSFDGAGAAGLVRLELVDTAESSYDLQIRVSAPNKGIGQSQTTVGVAAAGFQSLGIDRLGLYFSFQYQNFVGPAPAGAKQNDISYVMSVARTWTGPETPVLGKFTTFFEAGGITDLDGSKIWTTQFILTPGIRFWLAREHSLTFGVDVPVVSPAFDLLYRVTYIMTF